MGGYIIDGLFGAISDGIAKIKDIFGKMLSAIKEVFAAVDGWFKEKFSDAWSAVKSVFSGIEGWFSDRWNDIKGVFSAVGTWFGDIFLGGLDKNKRSVQRRWKIFCGYVEQHQGNVC